MKREENSAFVLFVLEGIRMLIFTVPFSLVGKNIGEQETTITNDKKIIPSVENNRTLLVFKEKPP